MTTPVHSAADIVADMVSALAVADPELDTSIGSVSRKILDVVGEQIAPASANAYLIDWVYSIDSKEGPALDDFVEMFGIYRIPPKRAVGFVTFTTPTAATANIPIPANITLVTGGSPSISFMTYSSAWLLKGTTAVTLPVQAVNAGASGNLPVGSITQMLASLSSIQNKVTQSDATTGGTDAESDAALRDRFRKTVFRSLAGTRDMFLGVALEDTTPDDETDVTATHANVVGPTSRWREQVQIAAGYAQTSLPSQNYKYVYPESSVFGMDIDAGQILTEGVQYLFSNAQGFTTGGPTADVPSLTTTPGVAAYNIGTAQQTLVDGEVYDLDFEYTSSASRNDPNNGITNRVDIWVAGIYPQNVSETTYWIPTPFVNDSASPFHIANYERVRPIVGPGATPAAGSSFLQLAWGPILTFPASLVINGVTYINGQHFFVVHETGAHGWSSRSRFGLEFLAGSGLALPPVNTKVDLTGEGASYFYNRLPADVEERARRWRMVTTDVMAHQAVQRRLILHMAIMYVPGYERGVVQSSVDAALSEWFNQRGFNTIVQVSDLIQIAHNVAGVDNIRFLHSDEAALITANQWGIEEVDAFGRHVQNFESTSTAGRPRDIAFMDHEVPTLYDVMYYSKAQNTFGTV